MKILILTGGFGMGHHSASQAVKEMILSNEADANIDIIDIIDYIFPKSSKVIYGCFNFMASKFSGLYNFFNRFTARRTSMPLKKSAVRKIDLLLKKYDADMVISTFPACCQYISSYKKEKNCDIPLYTYITDISVNEEWISEKTDIYFVGSENTKNLLLSKGVKEEKVVISGIPIKQKFREEKLVNIKENKKEVLIMGGGLGLVPDCDELLSKLSNMNDINVTFIAGKNKKLLDTIKEEYPNIKVLGYTDKVDDYMRQSDLIITKPGGITLFEAIYTNTPLYIIRPFLNQEIGNAKFIQEENIGKVVWTNGTDICEDLTSLLNNEILLGYMRNQMEIVKSKLETLSPLVYYNKEGMRIYC